MKAVRKALALIFLAALVMSLGGTAYAVDTYQVRVYAGNQGTIDGGDVREAMIAPGNNLTFNSGDVVVKDTRYYVRGIREAGLDNNTQLYAGNASIPINEDIDYVVAYGMTSSAVRYTVNYVSTGGDTLAPSETYYGNIGDKPVIAFVYVDGYLPQAYNLTKTLVADEGSNVFTFTYSEIPTTAVVGGGGGGAAIVPAAGAAAQPAAPAPAQPETIIDLDVPLAAPDDATTEPGTEPGGTEPEPTAEPEPPKDTKLSSWIPYVLGVGGVALLSAFLVALRKRRIPGKDITREDLEGALEDAKKEVNEAENKK